MSVREEAARGFQQGAAAYERGRPGYPREAVQWLRAASSGSSPGGRVLDVGAGTGKLTRELVPSGATVRRGRAGPGDAGRARAGRARGPGARRHGRGAAGRRRERRRGRRRPGVSLVRRPGGGGGVPSRAPAGRPVRADLEPPAGGASRSTEAVREIIEPYRPRLARVTHRGEWRAAARGRRAVRGGRSRSRCRSSRCWTPTRSSTGSARSASSPPCPTSRASIGDRAACGRVAAGPPAEQPIRLGYTTEAYVYRARVAHQREEPRGQSRIPGAWQPRTRSRAPAGSPS